MKGEVEYMGWKSGKARGDFICKTSKLSPMDKEIIKKEYWRLDEDGNL